MMENIRNALRSKPQISRLTPNQEIESNIEQLPAEIVLAASRLGVGEPDIGFAAEVGAPVGVVAEKPAAESAEDSRIESVDVRRRRSEAHLGVGEVEDEVFPLIAHIVALEAEEKP